MPAHSLAKYNGNDRLEALINKALTQCTPHTIDRTLEQKTDCTLPTIIWRQARNQSRLNVTSFIELYNSLAPLHDWNELDHQAWQADYEEDADTVIRCLMALKKSWDEGRYGAMIESDWPNP